MNTKSTQLSFSNNKSWNNRLPNRQKKSASASFFRFGFKNYSLVIKFIPNENLCLLFARINLYSEKSKKFLDEKEKKKSKHCKRKMKKINDII